MRGEISIIFPVEDTEDVTLQEVMEGVLTYWNHRKVRIVDGIITIYVYPDKKENISFLYEME
jgi:hypothetical protein